VLIRFYGEGSELFVDRQTEIALFLALSDHGLVEELFCHFENGCVYGFRHGRPLTPADVRMPHFGACIAREMVRWHRTEVPELSKAPQLLSKIRSWCSEIKDPDFQISIAEKRWTVDGLLQEAAQLERLFDAIASPIVLCHNDLLCANIIYDEKSQQVRFIDHEHAQYCYRGFDLGNHMAEFAGVVDFDWTQFPSEAEQVAWLRCYLQYSLEPNGFSESDVAKLLREVQVFAYVANLFWGTWSMVQARVSQKKHEFDYKKYGLARLRVYLENRSKVFG